MNMHKIMLSCKTCRIVYATLIFQEKFQMNYLNLIAFDFFNQRKGKLVSNTIYIKKVFKPLRL